MILATITNRTACEIIACRNRGRRYYDDGSYIYKISKGKFYRADFIDYYLGVWEQVEVETDETCI